MKDNQDVRETVRKGYSAIATKGGSCCGPSKGCCVSSAPGGVAKAVGYSDAELATLPEGADMGLSCGNPTALAALREGVVVLDLGAGGGFDVFLVGHARMRGRGGSGTSSSALVRSNTFQWPTPAST